MFVKIAVTRLKLIKDYFQKYYCFNLRHMLLATFIATLKLYFMIVEKVCLKSDASCLGNFHLNVTRRLYGTLLELK